MLHYSIELVLNVKYISGIQHILFFINLSVTIFRVFLFFFCFVLFCLLLSIFLSLKG